jgi:hypothetical protein
LTIDMAYLDRAAMRDQQPRRDQAISDRERSPNWSTTITSRRLPAIAGSPAA